MQPVISNLLKNPDGSPTGIQKLNFQIIVRNIQAKNTKFWEHNNKQFLVLTIFKTASNFSIFIM